MTEKLIRDFEHIDSNSLEDFLMLMAKSVEDSLIQSGAEPVKDYTYLDLYKLAQPFALEAFKRSETMTFSGGR